MFIFEMLIKSQYTVHLSDCQGQIPKGIHTIKSSRILKYFVTSLTVLLIYRKKSEQVSIIDEGIYPSEKGYTFKEKT